MWKLLSRLKSKKHQTKKNPAEKKQQLYTQLTAAIDSNLNEESKIIEADLKMRRSLSVVSLRPKTDSLLSRRGSFAEKALKLTEVEIAHLTKSQKRKIRSLNTNSLKFEDLASLRSSINALDEILHPSEETRTLENNVRRRMSLKDLRTTHAILSSAIQKLEKSGDEKANKEIRANTEDIEFQKQQEEINKKKEEEMKRLEEEKKQQEEAIKLRMEEIQRKYEEELRDEEERTRRLHEKLTKLKKMEKQFEQEEEQHSRQYNEQQCAQAEESNNPRNGAREELHAKEIPKQQEMENNQKAQQKEKDQIQQGDISFILSKLQQNDLKIKKLDLSGKKIGNTYCCKLMEMLQFNNTITTLILQDNDLDNSCVASICNMLHKNSTLHTLDLSNNFITNPVLIVEALEHNSCICNLELGRYASEDTLDQMEEYLDRNFNARQFQKH